MNIHDCLHLVDLIQVRHAIASGVTAAAARIKTSGRGSSAGALVSASALARAATVTVTATESAGSGGIAGAQDDGVRRVLVVDDDAGQQRVLKAVLSKDGFQVELARDSASAMAAVEKTRFHLVVLKAALPVMAGWQLAPQLSACAAAAGTAPSLPMLGILSATSAAEEEARYREAGVTCTLSKPVKKDDLLAKVQALLSQSAVHAGPPPAVDDGAVQGSQTGVAMVMPLKVLVADDDSGQRLLLKSMLTRDKHLVDVAENGDLAVKLATKTQYDVILIDWLMPGINGWEVSTLIYLYQPSSTFMTFIDLLSSFYQSSINLSSTSVSLCQSLSTSSTFINLHQLLSTSGLPGDPQARSRIGPGESHRYSRNNWRASEFRGRRR